MRNCLKQGRKAIYAHKVNSQMTAKLKRLSLTDLNMKCDVNRHDDNSSMYGNQVNEGSTRKPIQAANYEETQSDTHLNVTASDVNKHDDNSSMYGTQVSEGSPSDVMDANFPVWPRPDKDGPASLIGFCTWIGLLICICFILLFYGMPDLGLHDSSSERIVGGTEAVPNSWPWMVSLQDLNGFPFCGGSIINKYWVLTAAHCLYRSPSRLKVVAGLPNQLINEETKRTYQASRIIVHEAYRVLSKYDSDSCLIKLRGDIEFSSAIQSVGLPNTALLKVYGMPDLGMHDSSSERIVGGTEAVPNSWPWMVSLQDLNGFPFCGGSIINKYWVLTAAHCLNRSLSSFKVVAGLHNQLMNEETKRTYQASRIIQHKFHRNLSKYDSDIGLIKLSEDIEFSSAIQPVSLPKTALLKADMCVTTGWGNTMGTGMSNVLQQLIVPIISNIECRKMGHDSEITDNMMCAGYATGRFDACNGDSGGPLVCKSQDNVYTQYGITSWGAQNCESKPGVYTNVWKFIDWIHIHIKGAQECNMV